MALVTGASSGIGRAVAKCLAQQGFAMALVARRQKLLEQLQSQLAPAKAVVLAQDLTDFGALDALVASVHTQLGPIDVLINNAGITHTGTLESTSVAEWEQVLAVNLTATFALTRAVLPGMRARKGGRVINLVSVAGERAFAGWGAYCASKAGVLAMTRVLAEEVRSEGVRVTAICPGAVDTPLWDSVGADFDRQAMLSADTVASLVLYAVNLPPDAVLEEATLMPGRGAL
ncbi:SDR family oxidoreductase [Gloeobacter morelensis]|uniref:SDR family oxidoreductase n=1 Tax=Gloeobacter morelensis TaxID=2907343 RepID=UPI001E62C133|nr:SDR family oxidoreductase [Gloeobacter morelensis]